MGTTNRLSQAEGSMKEKSTEEYTLGCLQLIEARLDRMSTRLEWLIEAFIQYVEAEPEEWVISEDGKRFRPKFR